MDEAEQLCDRLVVMDKGKIAAEGSPRELINEYSTRDVVEVRFAVGENEIGADKLLGLAPRIEVLPDRVLLYTDDGDACVDAVQRSRASTRSRRSCGAARSKTYSSG